MQRFEEENPGSIIQDIAHAKCVQGCAFKNVCVTVWLSGQKVYRSLKELI